MSSTAATGPKPLPALNRIPTPRTFYPLRGLFNQVAWGRLANLRAILDKDVMSYTISADAQRDLNTLMRFLAIPPVRSGDTPARNIQEGDYYFCRATASGTRTPVQITKVNVDGTVDGTVQTLSGSTLTPTATVNNYRGSLCTFMRAQFGGSQQGGQATTGLPVGPFRDNRESLPVLLFNLNQMLASMDTTSTGRYGRALAEIQAEIDAMNKVGSFDAKDGTANPYIPSPTGFVQSYRKQFVDPVRQRYEALKRAMDIDSAKLLEVYQPFKDSVDALATIHEEAKAKQAEIEQRIEQLKLEEAMGGGAMGGGARVQHRKRTRKSHKAGRKGSRKN